jgi:putative transposon-encoded protein
MNPTECFGTQNYGKRYKKQENGENKMMKHIVAPKDKVLKKVIMPSGNGAVIYSKKEHIGKKAYIILCEDANEMTK